MNLEKEYVIVGDNKYYVENGHLDLSNKNLSSISEILRLNDLINLNSLDLSNNLIETISGLDNLKNLHVLNFDNNLITKIQGLENLYNLRELKLGTKENLDFGISKLEGLENLRNLRILSIKVSFINEISGLDHLKKLEELSIIKTSYIFRSGTCKVFGISELTNLKKLNLQGLRIGTLIYFKDLEQLEELIIRDCELEEINYLSKLHNLKFLDLSSNFPIKKIKGLDALKNLTELHINDCFQVTKISGLDSLKNLKILSLRHNQIEYIEGLERLTSLLTMDLSSNKIKIFQGVGVLNKLVELDLSYNKELQVHIMEGSLPELRVLKLNRCRIKTLEEIPKLSHLEELHIDDNNFESLDPLKNLFNLRVLSIEDNRMPNPNSKSIFDQTIKLSDLSSLKSISSLEVLNLSDNDIVDISNLTELPNLKELNLFLNKGIDISPLGKITSLEKLELHYCDIKDITVLKDLKNLRILNLQKNEIKNFEPLEHLEKLEVILISRDQLDLLSNLSKDSTLYNLFYCYKEKSNNLIRISELDKQIDLKSQKILKEKQESEAKNLLKNTITEIKKFFASEKYITYKKERTIDISKWFEEDMIDQELYEFFNVIRDTICYTFAKENEIAEYPEDFLANPMCKIDPNQYINAAITESVSESNSRFDDHLNLEDLINVYLGDFLSNARKWMLMHLYDFFLERFNKHALKFSPESIEKLVETGIRNILHSQFSLIHIDLGLMENWITYLDEIFATCETDSLNYQIFMEDLKNNLIEKDHHNIL